MKCIPLACFLLACSPALYAQYYYNDIVAAAQSNQQYQLLKVAHVKEVNATSFEADGKQAEGFQLKQQLTADYRKMTTRISNPATGASITTSSYNNNQLITTADSSAGVMTTTTYVYQPDGKVVSITSVTSDAARSYRAEEVHVWQYDATGKPSNMLKIKDRKDTTVITFIADEQGNVGEERWTTKGRRTETYYYYYNAEHRLTDIVRFNTKARRLLPDYLFEYDAAGRVAQMTQVPAGTSNYMVWKYEFTAQGLKQRELCYNKQQQPVGRIEYSYN